MVSAALLEPAGAFAPLFDHFPLLADAPRAVPRLRELILQLAVRGRLVPQDPADEPASELLKRITAEKARLIREGKIKAQKPLPPIQEGDVPYVLPKSWVWARIGDMGRIVGGGTPDTKTPGNFANPPDGVVWLTPADLYKHEDRSVTQGARNLSRQGYERCSAQLLPQGAVVFRHVRP